MKKFITLLLLTLSVYSAFSQDVITYKNGKTQKVLVLTTNDNDITGGSLKFGANFPRENNLFVLKCFFYKKADIYL